MICSIRLSEEERTVAESYATCHSMSLQEAFKRALFERIEDEYGVMAYDDTGKD
ncbi:MAG: antitoxin [Ruminococcus sp.]|nr:antitoxin [Ruminococcus sp.]